MTPISIYGYRFDIYVFNVLMYCIISVLGSMVNLGADTKINITLTTQNNFRGY